MFIEQDENKMIVCLDKNSSKKDGQHLLLLAIVVRRLCLFQLNED
jgi:hypothetical protein